MPSNLLTAIQYHRLHRQATTLPLPTGSPSSEELEFHQPAGPRDASLVLTGAATALPAPVVLHAWADYKASSGQSPGTAVQQWVPVQTLQLNGELTLPNSTIAVKVAPWMKALRVSAPSVTGSSIDIDIIREESPR